MQKLINRLFKKNGIIMKKTFEDFSIWNNNKKFTNKYIYFNSIQKKKNK